MCNKYFLALSLAFSLVSIQLSAVNPDNGKTLFQSKCTACHNINQRLVGPALQNIDQRQSESWIISFVHSPSKKIASGDTAAANIYKSFQPIMMPDQADLKDDDVRDIIAYIKSQSQPVAATAASITPAISAGPVQQPVGWKSYYFWCGVATILVMLLAIFSTLAYSDRVKREYIKLYQHQK